MIINETVTICHRRGNGHETLQVTVVETGSMAGAAAKTGYTPSGIVRAVKALEGDLGFSLLYRNTRGIELTEEGKLVFSTFWRLLEHTN